VIRLFAWIKISMSGGLCNQETIDLSGAGGLAEYLEDEIFSCPM
jgi:hypothetical protein